MKKAICLFLCLVLCGGLLRLPAAAAGFALPESVPVSARAAYVFNVDTGLPLVEKNADEPLSVASLTKMMTVLLLVENTPDLDGTQITAPTEVYVPPVTNPDSSNADIRRGEVVTARSLLYAMLLRSGNEAAAIAAYHLGNGNLQNFYAMMNARAKELGCTNTNFNSAHGLEDMAEGNYSTARDMALIAQACWQHDIIRTAAGSTSYGMPFTNVHTAPQMASAPEVAYLINNTNHMLKEGTSVYRSYIRGLKTGSTMDAGRCFAAVAVNENGETYISVVLGSAWEPAADGYAYSLHDTAALLDWVFASFSVRPTLDMEQPAGEIPVALSAETDVVKLYPANDLRTVLPVENADEAMEKIYEMPERIDAPIKRGDVVGTVTVRVQGDVVGTADLLAGEDIARSPVLYAGRLIQNFFGSTYFYVVLVLSALFLAGYFGLMSYVRAQQRKRRALMRRRQMQTSEMLSQELAPPESAPRVRRGGRPAPEAGTRGKPSARRPAQGKRSGGFAGSTEDFDLPAQKLDTLDDFAFDLDAPPPPPQKNRPRSTKKPRDRR